MANKPPSGLVVFDSHHLAFKAEDVLKKASVRFVFKIVPAPRHLSLSCDYALQVPADKLVETESVLSSGGLVEGLEYHVV
ncbi:MAG: DUF3343 domain-containing protein [Bacillota bacterium]|nr:DUF3343 domain-containing protein [Bacillota bacterium]